MSTTEADLENEATTQARPPVPPDIFGPPPLIEGEDQSAYSELIAKVSQTVKPQNILEQFWVRDVVDTSWEVLRLRRLKSTLMSISMDVGLRKQALGPSRGKAKRGLREMRVDMD